ncbi:hypothetical protein [Kocuria palustris]|uniref:hypothetical protein n=1 Tax=Kocuria palustris TaxID=71999 RepID=UPI001642DCEB|nr:hypothetical protein [Kocuria palustris]
MITARTLRFVRGWTASTVATGAAVLAHTVAGGPWPPALLVVLCMALCAPVCMLLAGLRLPRVGLVLSVAVSQLVFHGLFSMSGGMTAAVDRTGHAGHAGHAVDAQGPALVLQPEAAAGHHHGGLEAIGTGAAAGSLLMPVLHVAAGILTVLVLRHGESLVLRLLATLLIRARVLIARAQRAAIAPRPRWRCALPMAPDAPRQAQAVLSSLRYRGPPAAGLLA